MQIERITSSGQLVPLLFTQGAVAASQTDVQLGVADGVADVVGYTMPFAGEIVAISADLDTAATAGSLTVGPTIGGTEQATLTKTLTTGTATRGFVARDTLKFAAGSVIGAEITSDASWNAITADLAVIVWVLLNVEGI